MSTKQAIIESAIPLPRDPDDYRYVVSFDYDDENGIREFFREYGVVVIRDVITPDECENTFNEFLDILEGNSGFRLADTSTWHLWPAEGIESYGQVQRAPYFSHQVLTNRQNPKLLHACSILLNLPKEELLVNHDRGCIFRPTKRVPNAQGSTNDRPELKTRTNLHFDLNPWTFLAKDPAPINSALANLVYGNRQNNFINENNLVHVSMHNGVHLQLVLNLIDNEEQDGGFICVPGFYKHFNRWVSDNRGSSLDVKSRDSPSLNFPNGDYVAQLGRRVPLRAGSLIIWDQRTPHGSMANNSDKVRSAQFLRVFPKSLNVPEQRARNRRNTLKRIFQQINFTPSDLGRSVFDLD